MPAIYRRLIQAVYFRNMAHSNTSLVQQFSHFSVIKKLKKHMTHGTECSVCMELSGIAIIGIGIELPLSELELE